MRKIVNMLNWTWRGLVCGYSHTAEEHVTSDGMVIIGTAGEQPEYAAAMFKEDYVLAERIAAGLVDKNPNDARARIALAHPQMTQRHYADAALNYDKAIALDPRNTIALYSRGLVAQEQEDFETAKRFYERTLEIDINFAAGHFGMAAACEGIGLSELVIQHATTFLGLKPNSSLAAEAKDMIRVAEDEMKSKQ